jgi:hypothetical protein
MNPELVQIWCNEYEFEWLSESLATAVRWYLKRKKAKLDDTSDVWTERFDGWLNKAKNPRKRQLIANPDEFFGDLETKNAVDEAF